MESERGRAPNIRDVAKHAGVSYQTVSRVLNGQPSIRESTKQRVLDAIQALDYRPNQAARVLVTNRSRTIGVLTSQAVAYGQSASLRAIEQAAREAGYRITTTSIAASEPLSIRAALDHLLMQSVEALVVAASQVRVLETIREMDLGVPSVTLQHSDVAGERGIAIDQVAGARLAIRHLADLGHTEIVHLAGPKDWIEADARMQGYLEAMGAHQLRPRAPVLGDWTANFGYYAGLEMLRFRDFTALFAASDDMALGFMHACEDSRVEVPGEMSVIGFDDVPGAAHFSPPLTTVHQNFDELGRRAVSILVAELDGVATSNVPLVPELVVRRSTAVPS